MLTVEVHYTTLMNRDTPTKEVLFHLLGKNKKILNSIVLILDSEARRRSKIVPQLFISHKWQN